MQTLEAPQNKTVESPFADETIPKEHILMAYEIAVKTKLNSEYTEQDERFMYCKVARCIINRPHIGVARARSVEEITQIPGHRLEFVNGKERFVQMIKSITDTILLEKSYYGADGLTTNLYSVKVPAGYVARVPYVLYEDVPQPIKDRGLVIKKKSPYSEMMNWKCPVIKPVFTHEGFKETDPSLVDKFEQFYSRISFKVSTVTGALIAWFPGRDIYYAPVEGEGFVCLGRTFWRK